ncbi:MAG: glutathione peroxidase [Pirellulaceae bacterium]|nr:glutathione peroxidase [Pirellulaceae bacterium]
MKSITDEEVDLSQYQGKVVLCVNVASRCGFTPQYVGLQALHEKYSEKGLVVLGFPCNQFGRQESGTNAEIAQFCSDKYKVTFDMFAKIDVKGEKQSPLYKYLTSKETNPDFGGDVKWNFEKFLIDRNGKIIGHYRSADKPQGKKMVTAIESALEAK